MDIEGGYSMLLENKVAVIYGGGGHIGGAVAHAFAGEGARVFLAGRNQAKLDRVVGEIRLSGGQAERRVADALDQRAVDEFVDWVVERAGKVDISFNLISYGDIQKPLVEISVEDFLQPVVISLRSNFLTTRAALRYMLKRGSGVILTFGGSGAHTLPGLGGFKIALDAIEGLRRQWACEVGQQGIRVVTIKTAGIAETLPLDFPPRDEIMATMQREALLSYTATLDDVGKVAAFVASDQARTMTASVVNISCGALMD
jgi:3-oxoacyl-[acyl-carrier protein] reductase